MHTSKNSGFSLIELIMAVAILTIATFGLCASLISTTSLNRAIEENSLATHSASEKMEEILTDFEDNPANILNFNGQTFSVPLNGVPRSDMLKQADNSVAGSVAVSDPPVTIATKAARIVTVTIRWKNFNTQNENRQFVLKTFVFEE